MGYEEENIAKRHGLTGLKGIEALNRIADYIAKISTMH